MANGGPHSPSGLPLRCFTTPLITYVEKNLIKVKVYEYEFKKNLKQNSGKENFLLTAAQSTLADNNLSRNQAI